MRGVDVLAQRQSYCKIGRRSRKWFYSLVWFLLDIAIHNAYILYQHKHTLKNYDEKAFRKQLMQELVAGFSARRKAASVPKHPRDSLHRLEHAAVHRDCAAYRPKLSDGRHGRRSHYRCVDCNVYLCLPDCYNKHVQELSSAAAEEAERT
jgi:hypothetical protein